MTFFCFDGYGADGRRVYYKGGGDIVETAANLPVKVAKESVNAVTDPLTPKIGDGGAAEMRAQEEERQRRVAAATQAVNGAFGKFDEPYFRGIADAYLDFQRPIFLEQAADARRTLPFGFASTASSAYLRKKADLERDIAREEAALADKASQFSNQQRGNVEQNRADLVSMAAGGTDAGTIAQMANTRAQALARPAPFQPIADLFQKYTALAANNARLNGGQGSFQAPLLFSRSGYTTGGGNAVREVQ